VRVSHRDGSWTTINEPHFYGSHRESRQFTSLRYQSTRPTVYNSSHTRVSSTAQYNRVQRFLPTSLSLLQRTILCRPALLQKIRASYLLPGRVKPHSDINLSYIRRTRGARVGSWIKITPASIPLDSVRLRQERRKHSPEAARTAVQDTFTTWLVGALAEGMEGLRDSTTSTILGSTTSYGLRPVAMIVVMARMEDGGNSYSHILRD
jgi:hypothetical protein